MYDKRFVKPSAFRSDTYRAFVRQWPCLGCGATSPIQACHTGAHGLGTKAPDIRCIPLCGECHLGTNGLDRIGPDAFQKKHNVDLKEESLFLLNAYLTMGNTLA